MHENACQGSPASAAVLPRHAGSSRAADLDAARGLGIMLVVYGHATRGLVASGMLGNDAAVQAVDHAIYAFHMPLFFFLSGLFAIRSRSKGVVPFLRSRLLTIVGPYLLWSLIQGGATLALAGMVNHPETPGALLAIGWQPIAQFWFLYALLLCQLVLLPPRAWAVPCGIALFAAAWLAPGGSILAIAGTEFPFFAAGMLLGHRRVSALLADRTTSWMLLAGGWLIFFALLLSPVAVAAVSLYGMGLAGTAGTIAAGRLLAGQRWLCMLGAMTMPIFLLHVLVGGAARAAMLWLVPENLPSPGAMLALITLLGLIVPVIVARLAGRLGIAPLLGFGRPARTNAFAVTARGGRQC